MRPHGRGMVTVRQTIHVISWNANKFSSEDEVCGHVLDNLFAEFTEFSAVARFAPLALLGERSVGRHMLHFDQKHVSWYARQVVYHHRSYCYYCRLSQHKKLSCHLMRVL